MNKLTPKASVPIARSDDSASTHSLAALAADFGARHRDAGEYMASMILELRNIAKAMKLYHVMVPLEYAYYEACSAANQEYPSSEDVDYVQELSVAAAKREALGK